MIPRPRPERFRLRRTMMFMNAQKPGLIKDAYIYGCDSIMLDLEDAVAENQKDAARFSLYHALKTIDYGDTGGHRPHQRPGHPHWQEDVRCAWYAGADGILHRQVRAPRTLTVERAVGAEEFVWRRAAPLLMAASGEPQGHLNAYKICAASDRMFGVPSPAATSASVCRPCPSLTAWICWPPGGRYCRQAAGIQCFDTVFTNLDDEGGLPGRGAAKAMGFDGKSLINPKLIRFVHQVFAPTEKEVRQAEKIIRAYREQSAAGVGVFTVDGKMIDVAFIPGAERTLKLARGLRYVRGDLV